MPTVVDIDNNGFWSARVKLSCGHTVYMTPSHQLQQGDIVGCKQCYDVQKEAEKNEKS